MERFYYAQVNTENICFAVSDLSGAVTGADMVRLESYDMTVLGKRLENGVWVEVPRPEEEVEEVEEETE